MELWVLITIAAAFTQNLRFALQKYLKGQLTTLGASYARFVFAAPFAVVFVLLLTRFNGTGLPQTNVGFFFWAALGGLAQILATVCLVALFGLRNFAVGVAFCKTETIQTAMIALVLLGEVVSIGGVAAILVSLVGVILISAQGGSLFGAGLFNRSAALGVGSGALFGVSGVSYRAASLGLEDGNFLERAAMTLAVVTVMQAIVMTVWLRRAEPGQISRVFALSRLTSLVGLTSMIGSLGWFAAFTLTNAAYVRSVGQIELVFTFAASILFFRETPSRREVAGVGLITAGIVLMLLIR